MNELQDFEYVKFKYDKELHDVFGTVLDVFPSISSAVVHRQVYLWHILQKIKYNTKVAIESNLQLTPKYLVGCRNQLRHQINKYLYSLVKSEYRHKSEYKVNILFNQSYKLKSVYMHKSEYSTYLKVERIINTKSEYKVNLQFSQLYKLKSEYITLMKEYHNHPSCTHFF